MAEKPVYCTTCTHAEFAHRGTNPDPSGKETPTSCDLCLCKRMVVDS